MGKNRNSIWIDPFEGGGGTYPPVLANYSLEEKAEGRNSMKKDKKKCF